MTFSPQSFMKSFDLFSQPFIFFVGDKKQKSTLIGGFISLTLIIVSSSYFYYLISMYFQNKIEPKINSNSKVENNYMEVLIQDNFFLFEMKVEGITLTEYEKKVGKKFLNYEVVYLQYFSDGHIEEEIIPVIECNDPTIHGYLCLEESKIQNKTLSFDSITSFQSAFSIQIKFCDTSTYQNCATFSEIVNTILKPLNYFHIYTKIKQYNSVSREYEVGYKSEVLQFDPNFFFCTRISLIKATSKVIEGLIIQTSETQDMIYDFQRKDTYFSNSNLDQRLNTQGFGLITFELNQMRKQIVIQHSMITETFAQFMSIFNFLLTLGILAKILAENRIIDDINNILLKKYYKKTAAHLFQQKENQISKKNKNKALKQNQQSKQYFGYYDQIIQSNNQINQTNFFQDKKLFFKVTVVNRIKQIFSLFFQRKKKDQNENNENKSFSHVYNKILKQSFQRINIFQVYTDLIQLKMAIKILLTKEQYGALQFCGSEITLGDYLNDQIVKDKIKDEEKQKKKKDEISEMQKFNNLLEEQKSPLNHSKQNLSSKNTFFKFFNSWNQKQVIMNFMNQKTFKQDTSNNQNTLIQEKEFFSSQQDSPQGQKSKTIGSSQKQTLNGSFKLSEQSDFTFINENYFKQQSTSQEQDFIKAEQTKEVKTNNIQNTQLMEIPSQISKSIVNNSQQSNTNPTMRNHNSHLQIMDIIEDSQEIQEKFLKQFLIKMENNTKENFNYIDQQIFSSLLVSKPQQNFNFGDEEESNEEIPNENESLEKDFMKEDNRFKFKKKSFNKQCDE